MSNKNDESNPTKSKQQLKREAEAAQTFGAELVKLPALQLKSLIDKVGMPDKLGEALLACQTMKAREAHRRQLQYIGRLMRDIDCEPIEQQLAQIKRGGQAANTQFHQIERWRERLLSEGDDTLNELLRLYPDAKAKQLKQLIAAAHRESDQNQSPRSARLLFKYLRELILA